MGNLSKIGFNISIGLGLGMALFGLLYFYVSAIPVLAKDGLPPQTATPQLAQPASNLRLSYAEVLTDDVPVYQSPWHANNGFEPVRSLGKGYLWVSLDSDQALRWREQDWYRINKGEYVLGEHLNVFTPSAFQGQWFDQPPSHPPAWLIFNAQASSDAGHPPGANAPFFQRYQPVTIYETRRVGDWNWYRVGEGQWLEQRNLGVVNLSPRPEGVQAHERWIEVNLYEQTLSAYEGDRLVYATLISSGLPQWPTRQGLFRIWTKVKQAKMSGQNGLPDYYYLEDVPWTMYFSEAYALHAAYWHDSFGLHHSHGCVNMTPQDAQWLFNWVTPTAGSSNWTKSTAQNPGTWVWVHE